MPNAAKKFPAQVSPFSAWRNNFSGDISRSLPFCRRCSAVTASLFHHVAECRIGVHSKPAVRPSRQRRRRRPPSTCRCRYRPVVPRGPEWGWAPHRRQLFVSAGGMQPVREPQSLCISAQHGRARFARGLAVHVHDPHPPPPWDALPPPPPPNEHQGKTKENRARLWRSRPKPR